MVTTNATKRTCACGCGVFIRSGSHDDMTWACRQRQVEQAEAAERDAPAPPTREQMIASLRDYADKHGRSPVRNDCGSNGLYSRSSYVIGFGGWGRALEAASLTVRAGRNGGRPRTSPLRRAVLGALHEGYCDTVGIAEATGIDVDRVRRMLNLMRVEGGVIAERPPRGDGPTMPLTYWTLAERSAA